MANEKQKLIPFSEKLEQVIEADARRCRRSFARQVEALLTLYYGVEDVEIDRERFLIVGELMPESKRKNVA